MAKRDERKFVQERAKGGLVRIVDLTIDPEDLKPWKGLSELSEHVNREICQLSIEFSHLGMRTVELDDFVRKLSDRKVSEALLIKVFDGAVLHPLRSLMEKVSELSIKTAQADDRDMREVVRTIAAGDKSNFSKMLEAFEQMVETLLKLNDQDVSMRQSAIQILKEANRLAHNGNQLKERISGFKHDQTKMSSDLEHSLEKLVIQTVRDLTVENGPLKTKEALEARWNRIDRLLVSLRHDKNNFSALRSEYDSQVSRFFREQDSVKLYKGEWVRQEKTIRHACTFFEAAGLNPFELSDKLAGIDPEQVSKMPDCEEREMIIASTPEEFPLLDDNRIIARAENVNKGIFEAIEALEKVAAKPELPKVSAMSPTPIFPAVLKVIPHPPGFPQAMPPMALPPAQQLTALSTVILVELAVCTYAVFVPRFVKTGKAYPTSGRTIDRVYDDILVPAGMTCGCSREQFKEAVLNGVEKGWMHCFQLKGNKDLYQPTVEGFALAERLKPTLPENFEGRIRECYNLVKQADSGFRAVTFGPKSS